jgi:formylglycine-generating enzyme required for sulfatase activity
MRKAAEAGEPTAMSNLGVMYQDGTGVPRDEAEALKWYVMAAEAGHARAMRVLGVRYENGSGVAHDLSEAIRWYRKAAAAGDESSKEALQRLTFSPSPVSAAPQSPPPALGGQKVSVVAPALTSQPCRLTSVVSLAARETKPLSADEECALKPKDGFKECDRCPEMIVVPAGSFSMGRKPNQDSPTPRTGLRLCVPTHSMDGSISSSCSIPEPEPQHTVTIPHAFAVGKFTVTVDQFAEFVNDTGYQAGRKCDAAVGAKGAPDDKPRSFSNPGFPQTGSHPAVCLTWHDSKAYVTWLSKKTGRSYRLLSEAEWEYAAQGRTEPGSYPRFFFGDDEADLCRYANVRDEAAQLSLSWSGVKCSDGYAYTAPVGSFLPNAFGLYDMFGNATQWIEDCQNQDYNGAPNDGSAWTSGDCTRHAMRGPNWSSVSVSDTVERGFRSSDYRSVENGFRLARTLTR